MSCLIWIPLKLVPPPRTNLSEIFEPTLKIGSTTGPPHEDQSVTTKDIIGVYSGIFKIMNDCFFMSMQCSKRVCCKLCTMYVETECCMQLGMRLLLY